MVYSLVPVTRRPCDQCPFRTDRTCPANQVAPLQASAGLAGAPYPCPQEPDRLCAAWTVMCWRGNRAMLQAVQQQRILAANLLQPKRGWPTLHPTVAAVLAAGVERNTLKSSRR